MIYKVFDWRYHRLCSIATAYEYTPGITYRVGNGKNDVKHPFFAFSDFQLARRFVEGFKLTYIIVPIREHGVLVPAAQVKPFWKEDEMVRLPEGTVFVDSFYLASPSDGFTYHQKLDEDWKLAQFMVVNRLKPRAWQNEP